MADTAVAITAGTGTNIDTRTESTNGNHRQVVTIGDPSTNAGVAPVDATAGLKVDLGADNDVTVTGTVDLGATDNAVLDAIAASVAAVDTDTTTIIGHVDGIETLLGTIDADTSNLSTKIDTIAGDTTSIQTAVELIDDTVYTDGSGTPSKGVAVMGTDGTNPQILKTDASGELQIDVLSMPTTTVTGTVAVTNAGITTIAGAVSGTEMQVDVLTIAAGDNNIGNVDVVTLPALAAGTNAIGKLLAPDIDVTAHTNYAKKYYTNAGAVTDGIVWSPAAGKRWHAVVIHFQVSADCTVTLEDDKAGGDEVVWKGEYKAGSGHTLTFSEKYPLASGEDAADLLITTSAGNIYLLAVGYEI